jgi:predicted NACHT family NTPase
MDDVPAARDAQRRGIVGASDAPESFAAEFMSLSRRRMVITGGPGTGKSTLALQLLLELIPSVADAADSPIPVLLAAAEWNPSSEAFHEFVASQLNFGYPALSTIHPEASCELVSRLIVILDGLDEVPSRRRVQMLQTLIRRSWTRTP